jgi:hypothetical protein
MFAMILTSVSIVAAAAQADSESLKITDAWVPAAEKSGSDVPLLMTIRNDSSSPDALMRVRCNRGDDADDYSPCFGGSSYQTEMAITATLRFTGLPVRSFPSATAIDGHGGDR